MDELSCAPPRVLIISTGATMFLTLDETSGNMKIGATVSDVLATVPRRHRPSVGVDVHAINARSGAELSFETIFSVRSFCVQSFAL